VMGPGLGEGVVAGAGVGVGLSGSKSGGGGPTVWATASPTEKNIHRIRTLYMITGLPHLS